MSSLANCDLASSEAAIEYQIKVTNATEHLFEVRMTASLPNSDQRSVIIALPAWIPGSYMIRDFSRNLHALRASDSNVVLTQLDKQQWKVSNNNQTLLTKFTLTYLVYAFDLSVRSAFINDQYAFFNGTSVYLSVKGFEFLPHKVNICDDQDTLIKNIATALPSSQANSRNFLAADYFELVDHPVIIGKFDDYCFDVRGHRFHLVFTGEHSFDFPRMERDLTPIIEHHIDLFGEFPCQEYWFMTLVCEQGFGGLEHLYSTVLQYTRFDLPAIGDPHEISQEYQQFLSLCSHELFHTWHVKRIKPLVMHQPNLMAEIYTPQLWIYEGFTSFYDDVSLARTGVITPVQYVQILNETLTRLVRNPGRLKQSVSTSSIEAWNKFYKQDAGSVNHIVSYYNKGAVIALCLDITLRQQSNNKVTLDDVMSRLWQQYGSTNKGTPNEVILNLCQKDFDIDLTSFLHLATQTTMDLPLPTLLTFIGLTLNFRPCHHFKDKGGESKLYAKYDVGAVLTFTDNNLKVVSILEERCASRAGLHVGDIIVAFNKWQCDEKRFMQVLNQSKLGDILPIDVLRDGRLLTLRFEVSIAVLDTCEITISNLPIFEKWLGLDKNTKAS